MTCLDRRPNGPRGVGVAITGSTGVVGDAWGGDVATIEAELSVASRRGHPAEGRGHPARRRGAGLGRGRDPSQRRRLRGLRELSRSAVPARHEAVSGIRVHLARGATRRVPGSSPRVAGPARVIVEGGRAVGVEGTAIVTDRDRRGRSTVRRRPGVPMTRRLIVRAPTVVLAAGALRTPAILQATGLGHPSIGRHLRLHPVPVVAGRLADPVDMWRGTMQAARSHGVR